MFLNLEFKSRLQDEQKNKFITYLWISRTNEYKLIISHNMTSLMLLVYRQKISFKKHKIV